MKRVATHYIEERRIFLEARYEALISIAKEAKVSPEKVILPDF